MSLVVMSHTRSVMSCVTVATSPGIWWAVEVILRGDRAVRHPRFR
jgi:hypothetical protein